MKSVKQIFLENSKIAFDLKHRRTINYNISRYDESVRQGRLRYRNLDLAKSMASEIKDKVVSNLADYLEEFERNAQKNGIRVIWVRNGKEAVREVLNIVTENNAKILVKSKSMISEEIQLNENIERTETIETDLGEFIVQVAGEKPYHILTPAMHKSKEDVAELFSQKFDMPEMSTPGEITLFVRNLLRKKFLAADIGITGANFLVADTGGISLTENEGNGLMTVSFPNIHIVITGIEKIVPSLDDLPLVIPLLAASGTGQQVSVYNSLITGPRKTNENNGPEKMYVILLDNKRTDIALEKDHYKSLKCMRCGACLNACPIYKNVGGYCYNTTYSGPIGSVITPFMRGFKKYGHLSFACSLCGACSEVCPVKIPLHHLLLLNRRKNVESNHENFSWKWGMKAYKQIFSKRKNLDMIDGQLKTKLVPGKILGSEKTMPPFAKNSYGMNHKQNI